MRSMMAAVGVPSANLITAYLAVATAAATGVFAVVRYMKDRADARKQIVENEEKQLEQRRREEQNEREDHAAALIRGLGDSKDPASRRWVLNALALYPAESVDLLLMSLGEADEDTAASIKLAIISMGSRYLPHVVRMNRLSAQIALTGEPVSDAATPAPDVAFAQAIRDCTRDIIVGLLFQLSDQDRIDVDLAHVDLQGIRLTDARMNQIRFRLANLDGAILARSHLDKANLRGTSLTRVVATRATLCGADLTGAHGGALRAIKANLEHANLTDADLTGSQLDGAHINHALLRDTRLGDACLNGAGLSGATLRFACLKHAHARKLHAEAMNAFHSDFSVAELVGATMTRAKLKNCWFPGADASELRGMGASFTQCKLGGTIFHRADLT